MNSYFTYPEGFIPGTLIRAEEVNDLFTRLEVAFDLIEEQFPEFTGDFVSTFAYKRNQSYKDVSDGSIYVAVENHTSTTVLGDLSAGKVARLLDATALAQVLQDAQLARDIAAGFANYRGDYNPMTPYLVGQSVSFNGEVFAAKTPNTGVTPVDGPNWFNLDPYPDQVRRPVAISPVVGQTTASADGPLQATAYAPMYSSDVRAYREFQVANGSDPFFTAPIFTVQLNANETMISPTLALNTTYNWRCRDVTTNGLVSPWMNTTNFTTANVIIAAPTVMVDGAPTSVPEETTIQTSVFDVSPDGFDTHLATDWEIRKVSDNSLVYSRYNDTVNKTSLLLDLEDIAPNTSYFFRARHIGAIYGAGSWGQIQASTLAAFPDYFSAEIFDDDYRIENYQATSRIKAVAAIDDEKFILLNRRHAKSATTITGSGQEVFLTVYRKVSDTGSVFEQLGDPTLVLSETGGSISDTNNCSSVLMLSPTVGVLFLVNVGDPSESYARPFTYDPITNEIVLGVATLIVADRMIYHTSTAISSSAFVLAYRAAAGVVQVGTVAGVGAMATIELGVANTGVIAAANIISNNAFSLAGLDSVSAAIAYRGAANTEIRQLAISGTGVAATITAGAATTIAARGSFINIDAFSSTLGALTYTDAANTTLSARTFTVSGATVTLNAAVTVDNAGSKSSCQALAMTPTNVIIYYNESGSIIAREYSVSGTSLVTVTASISIVLLSNGGVLSEVSSLQTPAVAAPNALYSVLRYDDAKSAGRYVRTASVGTHYFGIMRLGVRTEVSPSLISGDLFYPTRTSSPDSQSLDGCTLLSKSRAVVVSTVSDNFSPSSTAFIQAAIVRLFSIPAISGEPVELTSFQLDFSSFSAASVKTITICRVTETHCLIAIGFSGNSSFLYSVKFDDDVISAPVSGARLTISAGGVASIQRISDSKAVYFGISTSQHIARVINIDPVTKSISLAATTTVLGGTANLESINGGGVAEAGLDGCMLDENFALVNHLDNTTAAAVSLVDVSGDTPIISASRLTGITTGSITGYQVRLFAKRVSSTRAIFAVETGPSSVVKLFTVDLVLGGFRINASIDTPAIERDIQFNMIRNNLFLLNNQYYIVNPDGSVSPGPMVLDLPFVGTGQFHTTCSVEQKDPINNDNYFSRRGIYTLLRLGAATQNRFYTARFTLGRI